MKERLLPKKNVIKALEKLQAGEDIPAICRQHNICAETLYAWQQQYSSRDIRLIKELRRLMKENRILSKSNEALRSDIRQLKEMYETFVCCGRMSVS